MSGSGEATLIQRLSSFFVLATLVAPAVLTLATASHGEGIVNGDFEAGTFAGWETTSWGSGAWYVSSGSTSPQSGWAVTPPPGGTYAALTDQSAPGAHVLAQLLDVPATPNATLAMTLYYQNRASAFASPDHLRYDTEPNQQYRVDLMTPGAGINSTSAADVVANLFRTVEGDPLSLPPTRVCADLTPYANTTLRLRFAMTDNQYYFHAGVDDVHITDHCPPPIPTPTSLPDLVVESIRISPEAPFEGESILVNATVRNRGAVPANASDLRLVVDGGSTTTLGLPPVPPNDSTSVHVLVSGTGAGNHTILAQADPLQRIDEQNETNNARSLAFLVRGPVLASYPEVPLYFQPGGSGLSSLPGKGAPTDATTRAGADLRELSAPLEAELKLDGSRPFEVSLPGRQPGGRATFTTQIAIEAVAVSGARIPLGQGAFTWSNAPGPQDVDQAIATARGQPTTRVLLDAASAQLRTAGDALAQGNPLPTVFGQANATMCQGTPATPPNFQNTCRNWNGDWDVTNLKMCTGMAAGGTSPMPGIGSGITPTVFRGTDPYLPLFPTLPANNNPTVRNLFTQINGAITTVNGITIVPANEALTAYPDHVTPDLCGASSPRNATERNVTPLGEGLGGATGGVGGALSDAGCVLEACDADDATDPEANWTRFSVDVVRSSIGDDGLLRVPRGWSLSVVVRTNSTTPTGHTIFYGREDARAALVVHPAEPGVFSRFAPQAEAIGPGRHTGHLGGPFDSDAYAIDLEGGRTLNVSVSMPAELWTPSGLALPTSGPSPLLESGRYVLRIRPHPSAWAPAPVSLDYAFDLRYDVAPAPQDDAGSGRDASPQAPVAITPGAYLGTLASGDPVDRYLLEVEQGRPIAIGVLGEPTVRATLSLEPRSPPPFGPLPGSYGERSFVGAAAANGTLAVDVVRSAGAGSYQLVVLQDETLGLAQAADLTARWQLTGFAGGGDLGEVDGDPLLVNFEGEFSLRENGTVDRREFGPIHGDFLETAAGTVLRINNTHIATNSSDSLTRSLAAQFTMGDDGTLYLVRSVFETPTCFAPASGRCFAIIAVRDGEERLVVDLGPSSTPIAMAAAPQGGVYVVNGCCSGPDGVFWHGPDGEFFPLYTPPANTFGRFIPFDVDVAADGNAYVSTADGRILRVAPGEAPIVVGVTNQTSILSLAAVDGGLVASGQDQRIRWLPAAGTQARHPAFEPWARADLAVTDVRVEFAEDLAVPGSPSVSARDLVVRIANLGEVPSAATTVQVEQPCSGTADRCLRNVTALPPLAPGEVRELRYRWQAATHAGTEEFIVIVDPFAFENGIPYEAGVVMEEDETNNLVIHHHTILVDQPLVGRV